MDEPRVGLQPLRRRGWARRGRPGRAVVRPRYEGEEVYGFVQPPTGATEWRLLPPGNTEGFSAALAPFAQEQGVGPPQQIVLALAGAGWHSGTAVPVPAGLQRGPLPPYSPERQPAERLGPLVDEPLANRAFATLPALDPARGDRCVYRAAHPAVVRGDTAFHWWPRDPAVPDVLTVS